jgi:hypothetical protein
MLKLVYTAHFMMIELSCRLMFEFCTLRIGNVKIHDTWWNGGGGRPPPRSESEGLTPNLWKLVPPQKKTQTKLFYHNCFCL